MQGFAAEITWGHTMREVLEADGFELTNAYRSGPSCWLLRAKPPREIEEGFGLAPEILLIAMHGEVQARDLQRAADEVVWSELRLDSNLVIVTDDTRRPLQERLDRIHGRGHRVAWVWDDDSHWSPLSEVLRQRLPTYDVFDEHDPVRGNQLMGRDAEVAELRTRVVRGDAVGVFGLRKMGKTSLVRAVTDWLDPASGTKGADQTRAKSSGCVLWVDAQGLVPNATADDVADELLAALRRRMRAADPSYTLPAHRGMMGLKTAGQALLDAGGRLCFVIDEYDLLFERPMRRGPIPGLSQLLGLLRAWSQQDQGTVSLVLIGRDPEHLSVPQLDLVSNPLLGWFSSMWLGPLVPPRDAELLRTLGHRVGLEVGHESAALAHLWTGGHPMLLRQFGSALREEVRRRVSGPTWKMPTDPYRIGTVNRFVDRDAVLTINREIIELLKKRYSAAYELMLALVDGEAAAVTRDQDGGALGVRMLRKFGILDQDTFAVPEHLSWYVRTMLPKRGPTAASRKRKRTAGRRTDAAR